MKKRVKKKTIDIPRSVIKKWLVFFVVVLIGLVIVWILVNISEKEREEYLGGNLGSIGILSSDPITGVYFIDDCDGGNFSALWDSVFLEEFSNFLAKFLESNYQDNSKIECFTNFLSSSST